MVMFTVGVRAGLWGTFLRHYNRISDRQACYVEWLDPTFTAAIHSSRSASEMDLHSRLTRGSLQPPAYTVATNARRRAKNTFFPILTVILGGR